MVLCAPDRVNKHTHILTITVEPLLRGHLDGRSASLL